MAITNPINKDVRIRDYFYQDAVHLTLKVYSGTFSLYFYREDIVQDSIKWEGTLMNGINSGTTKLTMALKQSENLNKLLSYTGELKAQLYIKYEYTKDSTADIFIQPSDQIIFTGYLSNKVSTSVYDYGIPSVTITLEDVGTKLLKKELYPDSLVDHYFNGSPTKFLDLIKTQTSNNFTYSSITANDAFSGSGNVIRVIKSGETIESLLKSLCLELGVVYYFSAGGVCCFFKIPTSAEPTQTITNFALNGSYNAIDVSRDIRKYKSARIQCDTYETFTGEVFRVNTGSDDGNSCNFELKSGEHYPELSDTKEPSAVECEDLEYGKEIVYMSSISSPTITSNVSSDEIKVNTFKLNGTKDILIDIENTSTLTATITKLSAKGSGVRIKGTDVYRTNVGVPASESDNTYEVETEWIHTKTQCNYLSKVLGSYFNYCDTTYTFYIEDPKTYVETTLPYIPFTFMRNLLGVTDNLVGQVVTLKDETISGLNVNVLVTGAVYDLQNSYVKYTAVGYSKFNMDATVLESKRLNANVSRNGATGQTGEDGKTSYFHIKYSEVANPTTTSAMLSSPSAFIGTYVDFSELASDDPTKYTWSQFKGNDGIAVDGKTSYFHIRYSNDGGATFTDNEGKTAGDYIGQYVDFTETDSTEVNSYTWSKIKGDEGETSYFHVKYSEVASPTTSAEMTETPSKYIGTYVDFVEADSDDPTKYKWTQFKGNDGIAVDGKDGKTSYFHIKYSEVASPTTSAEMTETPSKYIGTYVDFTETDSEEPTKYTWSQFKGNDGVAVDGKNGETSYLHIKYSDVASPTTSSEMTEVPSKYIGIYVDFTEADSDDPTKYKWSQFEGNTGEDGRTQYLHVKYSNDGGATFTANNGNTVGDYMGQCADFNVEAPTEVSSYTWVKIKGETGDKGDKGLEFGRITVNPTSFEYDLRNPKEVTIEFDVEIFGVTTTVVPEVTATSAKSVSPSTVEGGAGYQRSKGQIVLIAGAEGTVISWSQTGTNLEGFVEVTGIDVTEYNKYLGMVDSTSSVTTTAFLGDCVYSKETDCLYIYEDGEWVLFSASSQSDEIKSNLAGQAQRDVLSRIETGSTLSSEYAYFMHLITNTVSTNVLTMTNDGIIQSSNVTSSTIDNDGFLTVDGYRLEGQTSTGNGVLRAKKAYINDLNAKDCTITDATVTGELTGQYIKTIAPSTATASFSIAEQPCMYENSEVRHYIVTSCGGSASTSSPSYVYNIQGSVYGFSVDGYTLIVQNKQWGDPYGVEGYDFKYLNHSPRVWYCLYYCQASDSNTGFISYAGQSASDRKTLFPDGTEVNADSSSNRILVKKSDGTVIVDTMSTASIRFVNVTTSLTNQFKALATNMPYTCTGTVKGGGLTLSGTMSMTRTSSAIVFSQSGSTITIPNSGRMYGGNLYVSVTYQLAREGIETGNIYANGSNCSIGDATRYFNYGYINNILSTTIYGTLGNDLADCINIEGDTEIESGYCYCFDGTNYYKSNEYMDKRIVGINTDTAGFYLGNNFDKKQLKIAVAGFVLAYVDKEYEVGTPLTCTENGYLTEIKQEDKVNYPERVIAVYWKNEPNETWGRVTVNGRKWVKIR